MEYLNIIFGIMHLSTGMMVALVCIPLLNGQVKMNPYYGFRFKRSYESPEAWEAINRYGARKMISASVLLMIFGVLIFFIPVEVHDGLYWISLLATFILLVPAFQAYRFAREMPATGGTVDSSE